MGRSAEGTKARKPRPDRAGVVRSVEEARTHKPDLHRAAFAALSVLVMGHPYAIGISAPLSIVWGAGDAADAAAAGSVTTIFVHSLWGRLELFLGAVRSVGGGEVE